MLKTLVLLSDKMLRGYFLTHAIDYFAKDESQLWDCYQAKLFQIPYG